MTLVYPEFSVLQRLYPSVGVKLLKPVFQTDDCVRGNMLIGGKVHSEYAFKGKDFDDLYANVLKAQHFIERQSPKLLDQSVIASTASEDDTSSDASDQKADKVWVVSDELVERYRVPLTDVQSYLDRGFVSNRRNFAVWVDPAKIAAWTQRCKQVQLDKLNSLAKPSAHPGVDLRKGARLLFNKKTNERKRFPAHQIETKLAEGWAVSDLTAKRLAKVNVGAGRGQHFAGKKWIINIKSRAKQRVLPDEAARLIATGKFAAAGARTR